MYMNVTNYLLKFSLGQRRFTGFVIRDAAGLDFVFFRLMFHHRRLEPAGERFERFKN